MNGKSIGIIGGGLTGLTAAYYLKKSNVEVTIIEARDRLGGRVHTHYSDTEAPLELGATWLGKKHKFLLDLLSELHVEIFEQYMGKYAIYDPISTSPPQMVLMPYNQDPTYRIKGGSSELINQLANQLENESILLGTKVTTIELDDDKVIVVADSGVLKFDYVIITLPPKLFLDTIQFNPLLPKELVDIGQQTHTWMSDSVKVAISYAYPFWKDKNPIGSVFSNTGLISELYDHSDFRESKFALKGFISSRYAFSTKKERKSRVLEQLKKYFGSQVYNLLSYHETVWRNEIFTHSDYDNFILPHQNNGNPIFQSLLMDGKLHIGGSETASLYPGYMDGAVESGKNLAFKIQVAFKQQ